MRSRWRSATSSPRRASARSSRATTRASRRATASSASSAGRSTQSHAAARSASVPPVLEPPTLALHAVGATGMTAYFGLFDVGKPRPGDTVVVSSAAGAVGQIVGQLAKLAGCRTVGIAGGPDKARDLRELYGYDVSDRLQGRRRLGGVARGACRRVLRQRRRAISQAVHRRLNVGARIVICGQISQYNEARPEPTFHPGLLIVYPRADGGLPRSATTRTGSTRRRRGSARWVASGELRWREDVTDGLENAPRAFIGMLNGANRGKALVKIR